MEITWNDKSVFCNCVPNCFYFAFWSWSAWRSTKTYQIWSVLSIFGRCCSFPQYFGQVLANTTLRFVKDLRVCFIVAFSMVFIMLWDRQKQGEVLKLMRNDQIYVFLALWVLSLILWACQAVVYIRIAWNDKNVTFSCMSNGFYFVFRSRSRR